MELNPIVTREVLARWRHFRSFGLLFAYSALLAGVVGMIYASGSTSDSAAHRGHDLFVALTISQVVGWMMLAPGLTATSIAGEREQGLLEAVQLSRLSGIRIAWGKLLSALFLVALMLLVPLPIIAICFFTGGVSPGEFAVSLALYTCTAVTCAAIGLACSAWSRRPHGALLLSFFLVAAWGIGSAIAQPLAEEGHRGSFATLGQDYWFWSLWDLSKSSWIWNLGDFYGASNPVYAALSVTDPAGRPGAAAPLSWLPFDVPFWVSSLALQSGLGLGCFSLAVHALRRPLPEQSWIEVSRQEKRDRRSRQAPAAPTGAVASTVDTERPAQGREARWEMPWPSGLRLSNPVLQRELHGRLRLRRWSKLGVVMAALATLVIGPWLAYLYATLLHAAIFDESGHEDQWWIYAYITLTILICLAALQSAATFSRENEKGTREALLLSLLSPAEIVFGKLAAVMLGSFAWLLPFLPLLLPNIHHLNLASPTPPHYEYRTHWYGVSALTAIGTLLLLLATCWCYTSWGMLISWLCPRTAAATMWTVGSLLFLNLFVPAIYDAVIPYRYGIDSGVYSAVLMCWHPFVAMGTLSWHDPSHYPAGLKLAGPFVLLCLGGILQAILQHLMHDAPREPDRLRQPVWVPEL